MKLFEGLYKQLIDTLVDESLNQAAPGLGRKVRRQEARRGSVDNERIKMSAEPLRTAVSEFSFKLGPGDFQG